MWYEIEPVWVKNERGNPAYWPAVVQFMDDDLREQLHNEWPLENLADDEQAFFVEYAKRHRDKFGEDFIPYLGGNW
jgi:hypothetical protein